MSKKEVAKSAETDLAVATDLSAWGTSEISSRDIVIPKVLCMQAMSDLVTDGKAKIGDFVDSLTSEVIGSIDSPVAIVPFHMTKIWIISKKEKGASRYEFVRIEDVNASNSNYPFEEEIDGVSYKYEYTLQFYCLRPEDTSLPYVISFKSTSLKTGKVLSTQMYVKNVAAGLVPPAYTMLLGGRKEKNDQGSFIVMEVKQGQKTSPELIQECLGWLSIVKAGKAKVDESDVAKTTKSEVAQEAMY